jgi:hypothetical protein
MKRQLPVFKIQGPSDLFETAGDFIPGQEEFKADGIHYTYRTDSVVMTAEIDADENGVYLRRDTVTNKSDSLVTLTSIKSKFVLPDGDYEIYTQYNLWQKESAGGWQPLVTGVYSRVDSVRTAVGAAPVMAVWNRQSNRGIVFHLPATYSWMMSVQRVDLGGGKCQVEIVMGPHAKSFALKLVPAESLEYSKIIYYEFRNKTDLDCYKLHRYMNKRYPRRSLPVLYNTWLATFDRFTYDTLLEQAILASQIGVEYFIVDAGWYGEVGRWWACVGDWKENQNGAFAGRMKEFSEKVHEMGMKFGLWFEIERAVADSESVKLHPDYYIPYRGQYFVNFANPKATNYILDLLDDRIRRYSIDYIKFDFNANIFDDTDSQAFIGYYKGYIEFIRELKKRHPDLYLTNCASGGMRMEFANGLLFDSFWLSDNQCAYEGIRIFRDTLLRMPPQWIEKWAVIRSLTDFTPHYGGGTTEKILTTHDAVCGRSLAYPVKKAPVRYFSQAALWVVCIAKTAKYRRARQERSLRSKGLRIFSWSYKKWARTISIWSLRVTMSFILLKPWIFRKEKDLRCPSYTIAADTRKRKPSSFLKDMWIFTCPISNTCRRSRL